MGARKRPAGNRYKRSTALAPFGKRVRAAIERSKYGTRKAFLEATGISHGALYAYETGRSTPPLEVLRRMAEALDTTIGELAGERPPRTMKRDLYIAADAFLRLWNRAHAAATLDRSLGVPLDQARDVLVAANSTAFVEALRRLESAIAAYDTPVGAAGGSSEERELRLMSRADALWAAVTGFAAAVLPLAHALREAEAAALADE